MYVCTVHCIPLVLEHALTIGCVSECGSFMSSVQKRIKYFRSSYLF